TKGGSRAAPRARCCRPRAARGPGTRVRPPARLRCTWWRRAAESRSAPERSSDEGPADRLRKQVVEEEMQLREYADAVAAAMVDRYYGFHCQLDVLTGPDDPGVDGAGGSAGAAVERGRHREFHDRDHPVERRLQSDILHERLKIRQAVLNREAPFERVRIALDVDVAVVADRSRAAPRRDPDADEAGDRERAKELHVGRKIAEALAEEDAGCDRAERFGADPARTGAADVPVDAGGHDRFVRVV